MRSGLVGRILYGSTMTCVDMGEGILRNLLRLNCHEPLSYSRRKDQRVYECPRSTMLTEESHELISSVS